MPIPDPSQRPRISVLIPSYMRPDDLVHTLDHTVAQNFGSFEVIVVDDGTPGDAIRDTVARYPSVTYARPEQNLGLIGARNFGARLCRGDYILNLDDDSWLVDDDALSDIVGWMDANPQVGVAALNIELANRGKAWPVDAVPALLRHYTGCGNVYRRSMLDQVGDYIEEFRRQGEELERTMRIYDAGYTVTSLPSVVVFHNESPINRNRANHLAFESANYLRRELIRAPFALLPFGIARALRHLIQNRRQINLSLWFQEIFGRRVPLVRFVLRRRKPVSMATYLKVLRLG